MMPENDYVFPRKIWVFHECPEIKSRNKDFMTDYSIYRKKTAKDWFITDDDSEDIAIEACPFCGRPLSDRLKKQLLESQRIFKLNIQKVFEKRIKDYQQLFQRFLEQENLTNDFEEFMKNAN